MNRFTVVCRFITICEQVLKGRLYPAYIYLFKVNNRNSRKGCQICEKVIIKTPERRQLHPGIFIVNFEHISHLFLVFQLVTLDK